ncbi:MAG: ABC transporter permease [Clostridiales bacterium]|jgi:ABC-type transport system involved in multi-copper enzyme maturation permease subunit|nr:ABC transporter permease [Clostridiales bacterium]
MGNPFNLVKADVKRLVKDKAAYIILIVGVGLSILMTLTLKLLEATLNEDLGGMADTSGMMFAAALGTGLSLGRLGVYIALACSLFTGKDHAYNTVRNKLIAGNSRSRVYLSNLLVNCLLGLAYLVLNALFAVLIGLIAFGIPADMGVLLTRTALAVVPYLGIVAVVTFISMTVRRQAFGIVLNMVLVIVVATIFSSVRTVMLMTEVSRGAEIFFEYNLFTLFDEVLPGALNLMGGSSIPAPAAALTLRALLVPLAYGAAFTLLGIVVFRKADIH